MPNKTLYIRDADAEVWKRAEAIAKNRGTSVSQLAAEAFRAFFAGACLTCHGSPPRGFTCSTCGAATPAGPVQS